MLNLNLSSFHDYDIRGIYPTEVDENFYYHLGKSIALYFNAGKVGVGHDARLSSPSLTAKLVEGLTDYGSDVVLLGQISTEIHYYVSGKYQFDVNVIVSASHNPGAYNGLKIVKKGAIPLHGDYGLPEIKAYMNEEMPLSDTKGSIMELNVFDEYIEYCLTFVDEEKFNKSLKVVVDAGNGMGGPVWKRMQEKLKIGVEGLYLEPDGNFPNHLPDPLKGENMNDLLAKIHEIGADLGIAIDGDSDRIFFADEKGRKISSTIALAIFIDEMMKKGQIGSYIYNANVGKIVPETIKKHGGTPVRTRVGHSFIKEKMRELNCIFGGEHSGHFYFDKFYNAESPLIFGLMMIQILSESGKKMSELVDEFDIYAHSGEINFKVEDSARVIAALRERFQNELVSADEIDGHSFWFDTWWFITRLSKTEPLLRLNLEADNQAVLQEKLPEVIRVIETNGGVRK